MALIDGGPDLVRIWPEIQVDDGYGTLIRVPGPTSVDIRTRVQPATSDEATALGQDIQSFYRFRAREVPGGAWALIEWDGRSWDVVGEPVHHHGSPATRSVSVYMRARAPRPL